MAHDLKWFKQHEARYREYLRAIVRDQDKHYREYEQEAIAKNKPIRKPKGHEADVHDREWFWRDAFWCQSFGMDEAVGFFSDLNAPDGPTGEWLDELLGEGGDTGDGIYDWFLKTTNDVFRQEFPELAHILER